MSKKKKKIKVRRTWGAINPITKIVPNKKQKEEKKVPSNLIRGTSITPEDLEELDELYG